MSDALDLLPADCWRWYLMANAPESDDTSFTWELFGDAVNKDLVGTFGNFVNRTGNPGHPPLRRGRARRRRAGQIEARRWRGIASARDSRSTSAISTPSSSARPLRRFGRCGPRATSTWRRREPWKSIKIDRARAACTLRTALQMVLVQAVASEPFIPTSATRLRGCFGSVAGEELPLDTSLPVRVGTLLAPGDAFVAPTLLFTKLSPEELQGWADEFGGGTPSDGVPS